MWDVYLINSISAATLPCRLVFTLLLEGNIMLYAVSELNGQLIERVATEFNRLQFHVSKVRGLPLVDELKPVIKCFSAQ